MHPDNDNRMQPGWFLHGVRHCKEQSDEAIDLSAMPRDGGARQIDPTAAPGVGLEVRGSQIPICGK
jgi:hypothetical protein